MKITAKQYALALAESLEGKTEKEAVGIIAGLIEFLAEKGELSKVDKIIGQFGRIWATESGILEAEVTSARKLSAKESGAVRSAIISMSGEREVEIIEKTDRGILGGLLIKFGDFVFDATLKRRILELRKEMAK